MHPLPSYFATMASIFHKIDCIHQCKVISCGYDGNLHFLMLLSLILNSVFILSQTLQLFNSQAYK